MATVNVKVAVRCRPLSKKELDRGCKDIIRMDGPSMFLMPVEEGQHEKQFTFDQSYGTDTSQATLYEDLAVPILHKALEGYNGTIFAYGQTGAAPRWPPPVPPLTGRLLPLRVPPSPRPHPGSGKTHSMMGTPEEQGIVPLLARNLFKFVHAAAFRSRPSPRAALRRRRRVHQGD